MDQLSSGFRLDGTAIADRWSFANGPAASARRYGAYHPIGTAARTCDELAFWPATAARHRAPALGPACRYRFRDQRWRAYGRSCIRFPSEEEPETKRRARDAAAGAAWLDEAPAPRRLYRDGAGNRGGRAVLGQGADDAHAGLDATGPEIEPGDTIHGVAQGSWQEVCANSAC